MAGETWTIMVYMAGDNDLTDECVYALTEMKKANPSDCIRIFAQFDPQDDYLPTQRFQIKGWFDPQSSIYPTMSGLTKLGGSISEDRIDRSPFKKESKEVKRRRELAAGRNKRSASSALTGGGQVYTQAAECMFQGALKKLPVKEQARIQDTDTGSPATLFNFISLCLEEDATDRYMLVLAGHAAGVEENFLLMDNSSNSSLTLKELRGVFEDVQKTYQDKLKKKPVIDILGLDACLMGMAEVSYELKGLVNFMVGCESYSPSAGWPYQSIITRLDHELEKNSKPRAIATAIVEEYVNYYVDYAAGGLSVDQSAMDVTKIVKLKDLIKQLAAALNKELMIKDEARRKRFTDAILLAHWEAQSYNGEMYVDLFDFCNCLQQRYRTGTVGKRCRAVRDFIKETYIIKSCFSGPNYQYSYGVSLYFPWAGVAPFYFNVDFARDSGWCEFLKTYVEVTRRSERNDDGVDRTKAEVIGSIHAPEFQKAFRKVSGRKVSGKGTDNPIHSMRNPPIVTFPSRCLVDDEKERYRIEQKMLYSR